jgi:hypothetical protein
LVADAKSSALTTASGDHNFFACGSQKSRQQVGQVVEVVGLENVVLGTGPFLEVGIRNSVTDTNSINSDLIFSNVGEGFSFKVGLDVGVSVGNQNNGFTDTTSNSAIRWEILRVTSTSASLTTSETIVSVTDATADTGRTTTVSDAVYNRNSGILFFLESHDLACTVRKHNSTNLDVFVGDSEKVDQINDELSQEGELGVRNGTRFVENEIEVERNSAGWLRALEVASKIRRLDWDNSASLIINDGVVGNGADIPGWKIVEVKDEFFSGSQTSSTDSVSSCINPKGIDCVQTALFGLSNSISTSKISLISVAVNWVSRSLEESVNTSRVRR